MKNTKLSLSVLSILIVLAFTLSYAEEEKGYVPKENEEIYGTWVNENMRCKKFILKPDGTWAEYNEVSDTEPAKSGSYLLSGTFVIEDRWTDSEGNIWYKRKWWLGAKEIRHDSYPFGYSLVRISDSGKIGEFHWAYGDYPDEIDPEAPNYFIYYRK